MCKNEENDGYELWKARLSERGLTPMDMLARVREWGWAEDYCADLERLIRQREVSDEMIPQRQPRCSADR